ncbi:aspartate aminotransferase family protein [Magnetovibrio sp.]|uniref:aspartate aminotransferase family protein n=1 Tax=Magnetovibrio sp. TaxID=2024836 RepID=UPI002F91FA2A
MAAASHNRNDLEAYWMPFTANRQFKSAPRMLVAAKDMHYTSSDGRQILDGTAGLWCCNAGHGRPEIVEAIQKQALEMDYAPPFQVGHPVAFELASRLADIMPGDLNHVFFTNSGSESVDTALKIALAYHKARGEGSRVKFIGRDKGYHGVGFGGISVGGLGNNRKQFGNQLPAVDHMPFFYKRDTMGFSKGQPETGAEIASELEAMVALHDASTIAAVIVEPMVGSAGVFIPPKGYLDRLREICDKHGILLIFDEVITGFGRLGTAFAVEKFNVTPDLVTTAKGLNSGTVPMGAVFARDGIYDTIVNTAPEGAIELFHGYTYSAHPLACAAALATQNVYRDEGLYTRAAELEAYWQDAAHSLNGAPHVIDVRNIGLVAGIELQARPGKVGARAFDVFLKAFEKGLLIRTTGDTIALSPPLIISKAQIDEIFGIIGDILKTTD